MSDIEVTAADQAAINRFSCLNEQLSLLEEQVALLQAEHEAISDGIQELELNLEDAVRFKVKVADTFFDLPHEEALQLLTEQASSKESALGALQERHRSLSTEASVLKSQLYTKFGSAINLERA